MSLPDFIMDGLDTAPTLILAHGAGAPMDSDFMNVFAAGLAQRGLRCVRFEFPYMAARRVDGKNRPPNRAPILIETWRAVIDHFGPDNVVIGGKSMGGRIAAMVARDLQTERRPVNGLVCLGYPFHPPGKPEKAPERIAHLVDITTPTLILQGTRDTFGSAEQVAGFALSDAVHIHGLADGDHGFKPRKKSARSERQNRDEAIDACATFTFSLST